MPILMVMALLADATHHLLCHVHECVTRHLLFHVRLTAFCFCPAQMLEARLLAMEVGALLLCWRWWSVVIFLNFIFAGNCC